MKVALILSGQFRDAKKCYPSIEKNILAPHNPDVFISTWTNPKTITPSAWFGDNFDDDCSLSDIMEMYKPKSIELETFDDEENQPFKEMARHLDSKLEHPLAQTINVSAMFYKRHRANLLRKNFENLNGFKYDIVISSRFDLEFLEDPVVGLSGDELSIPIGFDWCDGICDLFAIGNSSTMDEYFDLFNMLKTYRLEQNVSHTPELIMRHHIEHKGMNLRRYTLKYKLRGVNIWEK